MSLVVTAPTHHSQYDAAMYCREIVVKKGEEEGKGAVVIGRLPLMLRSDRCVLKGRSEEELAKLGRVSVVHASILGCLPARIRMRLKSQARSKFRELQ